MTNIPSPTGASGFDARAEAMQLAAAFDAGRASLVGQVAVLREALQRIVEGRFVSVSKLNMDVAEVCGEIQECAAAALSASPASPDDSLLDEAMGLLAYWRGEGPERSGDANADTKSLLARYRTRLGK